MSWPLELSYSLAPDENDCDCCQGNGEIVTDWELYLHPPKGAPGDVGTAPCPDCRGSAESWRPPAETDLSGPQGTEAALSATDSPLNPSETNHG